MQARKSDKAKPDAKIILDKSLSRLKNVTFTSGKPEKIKEVTFKLSF